MIGSFFSGPRRKVVDHYGAPGSGKSTLISSVTIVTTLVAAEMVAAKAGLGVMVLNAARFLATDIVFLGIIVIGLIAFAFDMLMRSIEKALVPWKRRM